MAEKLIFAEQAYSGFFLVEDYGAYIFNINPAPFILSSGETYRVVWDGVSYECVAQSGDAFGEGAIGLGNCALLGDQYIGNNEPFIIGWADIGVTLFAFDDKSSHTVAIYQVAKEDPSYVVKKSSLTAIADAIRAKTGKADAIPLLSMPSEIEGIVSGGVDEYYQRLAEAVLKRDAKYLDGDATVLSMQSFKTGSGDTLASLAPYSFAGFTSVEKMKFTDVLWALANAFAGNSKLKIIDISVTTANPKCALMENALNGCSALEAVIFRPSEDGQLTGAWVHNNHGSNNTFYIYVPSAYYSTVIANKPDIYLPESRYRRLEDYPEIDNWNSTE